ncbi:MAG: hypothetical protein HY299_04545 [Verrucomicrobia bacterium]|nr:hypothetical protein [Verrucomicrobiota bacterium]
MKAFLCLGVIAGAVRLLSQEAQVITRGPDFRVIETTEQSLNDEGQSISVTHRHTELSSGMNYWTGTEWKKSSPVFRLVPGSAIADEVQHRFTLSHNINQEGAIVMETPDGKVFRSTPLILAFRDTATGESVMIAQIQDSVGEQIANDQIFYPNAMEGVACGLRYTVRKDGGEQELLIQEPLRPQDFGLENKPSVRLELWTAFYESPALERSVVTEAGEMGDLFLDFGSIQIGQGKTFAIETQAPEAPVAKRFGTVPGDPRLFLVEMIAQKNLEPLMNALEQAQAGKALEKIKRLAGKKLKSDEELVAAMKAPRRDRKKESAMMRRTSRSLGSGVILDYTAVSGSKSSFVFTSGGTFSITGDTTLSGASATFESGSVLKYASGVKLTINCPIVWKGTNFGPVICTAADDHSVGEKLNNNAAVTTNRFAKIALEINASTAAADAILSHVKICNAEVGISINGRTGHAIDHAMFVNCGYGVKLSSSSATLVRNALFGNVTTNLSGSGCTVRAEHVTSDGAAYFMSDLTSCFLTNSLLVAVTTPGTFSSSLNVQTVSSPAGIFATVGSGAHYLATDTYRNQGTVATSINAAIAKKTTYAPLVLTTPFTQDTVLQPLAQRDTDQADLGFHYDPLDFCWNNLALSAALTLTNGASVGIYGSLGTVLSSSSAKFISQGTPGNLNHLVRYNAVQENPALWGTATAPSLLSMGGSYSPAPEVRLRFTDVGLMGTGSAGAEFFCDFAPVNNYVVVARDSQFRGVYLNLVNSGDASTTPVIAMTNNIWFGSKFSISNVKITTAYPLSFEFRNNLVLGGSLTFVRSNNASAIYEVNDNLFDTVALTTSASGLWNGNNGYKGTGVMGGSSGGDIVLTTADYQSGPLGNYYYNTTSVATNTAYLINKGSASTSGSVGFYHSTTQVNQGKELNSVLDIGFHYIATTGSTSVVPVDTDGDGYADYWEDSNSDSIVNNSETNWQNALDTGIWVKITEPKQGRNIP